MMPQLKPVIDAAVNHAVIDATNRVSTILSTAYDEANRKRFTVVEPRSGPMGLPISPS